MTSWVLTGDNHFGVEVSVVVMTSWLATVEFGVKVSFVGDDLLTGDSRFNLEYIEGSFVGDNLLTGDSRFGVKVS